MEKGYQSQLKKWHKDMSQTNTNHLLIAGKDGVSSRYLYDDGDLDLILHHFFENNPEVKERIYKVLNSWVPVSEKLPEPMETVWITNGEDWVAIGCLVTNGEGWHWAKTNGIIYSEGNNIISECESDDLDVQYWLQIPKLPTIS